MKKFSLVFIFLLSCIVLTACKGGKKDYSFSLTIDSKNAVRESIVFEYTLNDEDGLLAKTDVKGSISKKGSNTVIGTAKTLSMDKNNKGTVTFTGLTAETNYMVRFYVGYKGKTVELGKYYLKTSAQGTKETPYEITTKDDFINVMKNDRNGYYKLMNDIDFEGSYVVPVFSSSGGNKFAGEFDGQGYTIKNYVVGTEENPNKTYGNSNSHVGFFGYIGVNSVVKNVKFDNIQINVYKSAKAYFGIVGGSNEGSIENVTVTNAKLFVQATTSECYVGGFVGRNSSTGTIKNCSVDAEIKVVTSGNHTAVGGFVGDNDIPAELHNQKTENIVDCNFNGSINYSCVSTSSDEERNIWLGGFIGVNRAMVKDCETTVDITADVKYSDSKVSKYSLYVGGLVGQNIHDASKLINLKTTTSFNITAKDASKTFIGGLVGLNGLSKDISSYASISDCIFTAKDKENVANLYEDKATIFIGLVGFNSGSSKNNVASSEKNIKVNYYKLVEKQEGETVNNVFEQNGIEDFNLDK